MVDDAHIPLDRLPTDVQTLAIVCPLCSAQVPIRGLRERQAIEQAETDWQLVFTCPACGLVTTFRAEKSVLRYLPMTHGSAWSGSLRHFQQAQQREHLRARSPASREHMVAVFLVSMLTWIVLIGNFNPIEVIWGAIVSLIVARVSYQIVAFNVPRWIFSPRRWLYFADLMLEFLRQIVVQNITLSIRVFRPSMPINPGIVAVPTTLRDDVELTILGSLVTLTPDTVTVDVDVRKGVMYLHWIDVKTTDPEEARRLLLESLETKIIRWLH